ncbi:MAG: ferredoxin oxidoreductase [Spirochaetales bacterium]|nr:ferredoxin oxidoreductase [Spirochaetales bacterium]
MKPDVNDFTVKVSNVNGSGSASANSLLSKTIFRMGIPVSAKNIFPSNIQGLPTWYEIRVNCDGHTGRSPEIDFLIAMNPQTFAQDIAEVSPGGYILYDSTWPIENELMRNDVTFLSIPLTALGVESFPDVKIRILMKNITYVGAAAAFLNIDLDVIRRLLRETYSRKPHLSDANMNAIELSHSYVKENFTCPLPFYAKSMNSTEGMILMNGNTAAALGCLYAGATVAAWYPITPATSITDAFKQLCGKYRKDPDTGRFNACIVQAEDELSAVGIAIGAGWAGVRAFTPTSGAGISLMGEFLGFAYYTEVPIVVFNVQRAGPSTGMPTRTQQADILSSAYASHGDTQHILLFPSDPEECFYLAVQAFDAAERFQTPVLVLSDLDIGMNEWMTPLLKWEDDYSPDRGKVLDVSDLEDIEHFYRYLDSDNDGICYRTLPGVHPNGAYFLRGSGHNKYGKYSEKGSEYIENTDRLRRKFETAKQELPEPVIRGGGEGRMGIISVGSCDGAVREARQIVAAEGLDFDYMRIRAYPFSDKVDEFLDSHERCVVIEQNRDAQLRSLLILETTGKKENISSILSYGGLPIDAGYVAKSLKTLNEDGDNHELRNKA